MRKSRTLGSVRGALSNGRPYRDRAPDHMVEAGTEGTRMIIDKVQSFVPGVEFWDVHSFIAEVLEP